MILSQDPALGQLYQGQLNPTGPGGDQVERGVLCHRGRDGISLFGNGRSCFQNAEVSFLFGVVRHGHPSLFYQVRAKVLSIKLRGLVVGLLSASSATGQLVFLPLMASLTDHLGWRSALVFVCCLLAVTALLAAPGSALATFRAVIFQPSLM